jgi:hypothetical protein
LGRVWSIKINHESGIKWTLSVLGLRLGESSDLSRLSTQAGYRLTFSTEGNAVGKVVRWIGNVGCQFEMGTSIGITRRDIAKNKVIRFYYCVFHYDRILKTERYVSVQVVLLLTLTVPYQGFDLEVVLKYWDGDISRGSLVFRCSKDNEAERRTTASINPRHKNFTEIK